MKFFTEITRWSFTLSFHGVHSHHREKRNSFWEFHANLYCGKKLTYRSGCPHKVLKYSAFGRNFLKPKRPANMKYSFLISFCFKKYYKLIKSKLCFWQPIFPTTSERLFTQASENTHNLKHIQVYIYCKIRHFQNK